MKRKTKKKNVFYVISVQQIQKHQNNSLRSNENFFKADINQ